MELWALEALCRRVSVEVSRSEGLEARCRRGHGGIQAWSSGDALWWTCRYGDMELWKRAAAV